MAALRATLLAAGTGAAALVAAAGIAAAQTTYDPYAPAGLSPELYDGELSAGLWYNSDVGPTATFALQKTGVFGGAADLALSLEGNAYELGLMGGLTIADAFGTSLTQDIVLNAYSAEARPTLGRDVLYSGGDLSTLFGADLGAGLNLRAGVGYQMLSIDPSSTLPQAVADYVDANGDTSHGGYAIVQGALDRADDALAPSDGYQLAASAELGRIGATSYVKLSLSGDLYHRLGMATTLHSRMKFGRGYAVSGDALPVFKNFTAGGIGDLRGYASGGIGPVSPIGSTGDVAHVGGDTAFAAGLELAHAVSDDQNLSLITFVDAASVSKGGSFFDDLRQSAGIGLRWQSPLGPLDVSLAKAINPAPTDILETLQVSFGMRF